MRQVATTAGKHGGMFPLKLHDILSDAERHGFDCIISWACHGRCFKVHKPKEFVEQILPMYFQLSKITSFQRQLNLYGFRRIYQGPDRGSYYHECFLRGQPDLSLLMVRVKIKGTCIKPASIPDEEPNFYTMTLLSPNGSNMSPPDGRSAFPISISAKAMPLGSDICPLLPTRSCQTATPLSFVKGSTPQIRYVSDDVSISKSDTSFPSMFPMKLDSNNSSLPYRAAIAEISFNGCNAFQQWLDVCNDAATNNIVDELFFEEPVDIDMIVDFCSTWMPSINDVTSRQR